MACCVAVATFIWAVDEALGAFGEARARAVRDEGGVRAAQAARYLEREAIIHDRLLAGRVLSIVGAAIIGDHVLRDLGVVVRLGAAAVLIVVVGTVSTVVARRAGGLALPLLAAARPLELLFAAPAWPLSLLRSAADRLFPPRPEDDPELVTEHVVEALIEQGEAHGSIDEKHAELLKSVIEFGDTVTREIMVPRTSMVAIELQTPLSDVVRLIVEKGHSRYPVYRERIDQLEGILYAKDLFRWIDRGHADDIELEDLIRGPVFFSSEKQKVSDLLRQMQLRRVHVAIVVDDYGGTSGLVTLEDIIEEIVGEISDEHDFGEAPVRQLAPGRYVARADVSVHDLQDITGLELPEEDQGFDSLGGLLVELSGDVPKRGQVVTLGDFDLIVRAADERRVVRVEIVRRPTLPGAA